MDRRSWPWKKKSSEKASSTTEGIVEPAYTSVGIQVHEDDTKDERFVQISVESYAHFGELESQVKDLNEKLISTNENLSSAQSEIADKVLIVKQHSKVAEEAISGWEKAEAEALALNHQLETVTQLKVTAEERVSHLEGALKECMRQVKKVKEDSEQKLEDVIFAKTKQWEKIYDDMQGKLADFEQKLLRASGENVAISRSLQERSNMLVRISEEKSEADAEIEVLKSNIQSYEKDISSFNYELHMVAKELEIRNEEKNMSMRSAEVANKHHLEDVKKIAKLEAECQRLRGLVRKKLPGPAALAQMKIEVDSLGRDYGENRMRRAPVRGHTQQHFVPDFAYENIQQCYKENEFLTSRMLAMEEETKMLKEALSRRNSELQESRNLSDKTMNQLHNIEAHISASNQQTSPCKQTYNMDFEHESNTHSLTTMSEEGIDEDRSYSGSWATPLILEALQSEKDKDKVTKEDNLELMDDFLEMEKYACQSTELAATEIQYPERSTNSIAVSLVEVPDNAGGDGGNFNVEPCNVELPARELTENSDGPLLKLHSRISSIFESQSQDSDVVGTIERIRCILQDAQEDWPRHSVSCSVEEAPALDSEQKHHAETMVDSSSSGVSSEPDIRLHADTIIHLDHESMNAISQIYDSVVFLVKEVVEIQDLSYGDNSLSKKIDDFSSSHEKLLGNESGLHDFILSLSCILSEVTELGANMFGDKNKGDIITSECIDKVTLLENKIDQHELTQDASSGSSPSSCLENDGAIGMDTEMNKLLQRYTSEEFEQLKMEKESMLINLDSQTKMLEESKQKLADTEQCLTELASKLIASEKSNSLSETQLKCMAESYKSLELRTQELELHTQHLTGEINVLRTKAEVLENELQEERHRHLDDLAKYTELQEKVIRDEKSSTHSFPPDADINIKINQDKEIAATAEKLAQCQETIFLLGRQLKAMNPQEPMGTSPYNRHHMSDSTTGSNLNEFSVSPSSCYDETENNAGTVTDKTGGESPLDIYNYQLSPSYCEAGMFPKSPLNSDRQKHRLSEFSASVSSTTLSDKHGRGISRFFLKGRKE